MALIGLLITLAVSLSANAAYVHNLFGGHSAPAYAPAALVAASPYYAKGPIPYATGDHGHEVDYYAHPKYTYNYGVSDGYTGDSKSHTEYRDGDVVKGSYSVAEPDGSIRVVHYTSDDVHGFNAVVKKIGPSYHPGKFAAPIVAAAPAHHAYPSAYGHGLLGGYNIYKH